MTLTTEVSKRWYAWRSSGREIVEKEEARSDALVIRQPFRKQGRDVHGKARD